jgi:hypothetical protein
VIVWHQSSSGWYFSQSKTSKSRRTIPLPLSTMKELRKHRIKQNKDRLELGSAWQNFDLVFRLKSERL